MNYNKAIIAGNLTRDPELRKTQSGATVTSFTVAINERQKDGTDRTSFINCEAFGKVAETIEKYFKKGKPIFIEGRLRQEAWEDKQGNKQTKIKVIVERFDFIDKQNNANNDNVTFEKSVLNQNGINIQD